MAKFLNIEEKVIWSIGRTGIHEDESILGNHIIPVLKACQHGVMYTITRSSYPNILGSDVGGYDREDRSKPLDLKQRLVNLTISHKVDVASPLW